jgi:hypothetical protein
MIRINVKEVLSRAETENQSTKEPPKIRIIGNKHHPSVAETMKDAAIHQVKEGTRSDLLNQVWSEFNASVLERKKLSNQIWQMVERGATKGELKAHYAKIDAMIDEGAALYDRIQHVTQYGKLPDPVQPNVDMLLLKDRRKKLVDLRCKLSKKLEAKQAKNPNRFLEWQLELDKANAEYLLIDEKIKKLEGKA